MIKKLVLYINTMRYMKFSQIYYRVMLMIKKRLDKFRTTEVLNTPQIRHDGKFILRVLDFNESYLERFKLDEILEDTFTFLNMKHKVQLNAAWNNIDLPHLWRYNLHYFEYLYTLAKAYIDNNSEVYYNKFRELVSNWIDNNSRYSGDGWHPYTISLRITNWISVYEIFLPVLKNDKAFADKFLLSIYRQYSYLKSHLEKDVLGNHYFENIKALLIGSIFFNESNVLDKYCKELFFQLDEQTLEDGMHFELSPMYHKIILEDLIRITYWLDKLEYELSPELYPYIKKMIDCIYSLEEEMGTTPLFNDSGNNVAKPVGLLIETVEKHFGITPDYRCCFDQSGYYIFKNSGKKLIADCGQVCPDYLPAHGHCDALSFEMSIKGHPFIVNSGTFEYEKGNWRQFFRSTKAHNTLMIGNDEQSQYWGNFRIAGRIHDVKAYIVDNDSLNLMSGSYTSYAGARHSRLIGFVDNDLLLILDKVGFVDGKVIRSYLHFHPEYTLLKREHTWEALVNDCYTASIQPICTREERLLTGEDDNGWYSPEFGIKEKCFTLEFQYDNTCSCYGYIIDFERRDILYEINDNHLVIKYGEKKQLIDLANFIV